ncbi:hypothetical protein B2I21_08745 [Chryseobacterium mucoviscidosis]|nr:hypothetical protein B2I21_08745 [Chryseobacterium mucoviscidosis]
MAEKEKSAVEEVVETTKTAKKESGPTALVQSTEAVASTDRLPTYVYLGPTLKTYALRQNATYVNGIPKQFQELVDTNPDISFLFVSLDKTVDYRRELKDSTSEQTYVFKQIQKSGV